MKPLTSTALYLIALLHGAVSFNIPFPYVAKSILEYKGETVGSPEDRFLRVASLAMTASAFPAGGRAGGLDPLSLLPPLRLSPPRKICVMVEPSPFTHISGYANRYNEMLRFLSKAGDKVEFLTVDQNTPKKKQPTKRFGYNIEHTFGLKFFGYKEISLSLDLPQMKGRKMLKRMKPDIIHVASPGFLPFPAMIYSRIMRIPLVMSYHTHVPMYIEKYLPRGFRKLAINSLWAIMRWGHRKADLTLCTSPQMKAELEAHGIPRVDVWRKGVDSKRFNPKFRSDIMRDRMTDGNPDDFLIVNVGRIGAEKRLKDVKPVLEKMGKNARLCIVGKGPHLPFLKKYFKDTNTVFTGLLTGDELSSAFASADAFIMPSDTETLGFVVMESMASAVPVVGARAGGVPDMIKDGDDGFLVPAGDTDAFVRCLEKLRVDPNLRKKMGDSARVEAQKWRWEDATSFLRNVQYEKAMTNFAQRVGRRRRLPFSKGHKILTLV